jgi:hypothetical protein
MCAFKGVLSHASDQMSLTVKLFLNMAVQLHLKKCQAIEVKIFSTSYFSEVQDF